MSVRVGEVFGYLTVLKTTKIVRPDKKPLYGHECMCTCGKKVDVRTASLINGSKKSCGCQNSKRKKELKH